LSLKKGFLLLKLLAAGGAGEGGGKKGKTLLPRRNRAELKRGDNKQPSTTSCRAARVHAIEGKSEELA